MINNPISTIMTTNLLTFAPETTIYDAMQVLAKKRFSGAPVVNQKKELVGMLSEKDCLHTIIDSHYNQRPSGNGLVGDYMSKDVSTVDASKTIIEVAYMFVHSSFKRFPVMERGKLVGQISRSDVLNHVSSIKPDIKMVPDSWKVREPML